MAGFASPFSLTARYIRTCQKDLKRVLVINRTSGRFLCGQLVARERFSVHSKLSTCLLPCLQLSTSFANYTSSSSSENGEKEGKKKRQRKSGLKSVDHDGDRPLADVPTVNSADVEQAKKTRSRKEIAKNGDEATADLPKKRKRRTKKSSDISDQELKDSLLHFVPFEGTSEKDAENLHAESLSVDCQNSVEGRLYHIQSLAGNMYSFPSVTTILENTLDNGMYYRLLNWRRKLTAEHGAEGFDAIVKSTLRSGSNFHQELENKLLQLSNPRELSEESSISKPDKQLTDTSNTEEKSPMKSTRQPAAVTLTSDSSDSIKGSPMKSQPAPSSANEDEITHDETKTSIENPTLNSNADSDSNEDRVDVDTTEPVVPQYMQSVEHVLRDTGKVMYMEDAVTHFELGYMGRFDCLAEYQGQLCLIDWKTSSRLKPSLADCYDYPLQAVAYAGAINQDMKFNFKVLNLLIVIVYASGEPAHAHLINHQLCQRYWLKWLHRLQTYQTRFAEDLSEVIS